MPAPVARPSGEDPTNRPTPSMEGAASFLDIPLNQFFVVVTLVALAILQNGYVSLRFDHVVQLPYLLMDWEPGLFARDWYLQSDPHDRLRFFHLLLIRIAAIPLGLEGGILALYLLFTGATFACWLAISKRLFGSAAQGVVVAVLAIFFNGWELGANHLVETIFIPRMEAYALCYLGLVLLLSRRPVFAGLAFAAGGLFQPAVPLQFAAVVALWILIAGERPRISTFFQFSAAYWIVSLPWMLFLRGTVVGDSTLTSEEIIHIFAWIRHPAHMIPFTWTPLRWLASGALLLAFAFAWPRQKSEQPALWRLGWMTSLIVLILAISIVFIEFIPLRWVILFQPFRVSVLLYLILFLVLSPLLLEYALSSDPAARVRAAALMVSVVDPRFLIPAILLELLLRAARNRNQPLQPRVEIVLWGAIALGIGIFYPWTRSSVMLSAVLALGLVAPLSLRVLASASAIRGVFLTTAFLSFVALGLFRTLPFESWMQRGGGNAYNSVDRLLMRYQLRVLPIPAVERLGSWVRDNTGRDALFIIPPERTSWGFRLFSHRAQVFDVKSIPYAPPGIEAWWERSLHLRGIFEPGDPANAERMQAAWNDLNMAGIGADYENLNADEMIRLAGMYEAEFVVSAAEYDDARLACVRKEPAPENPGRNKTLFLYRVVVSEAPAPGGKRLLSNDDAKAKSMRP